MVSYLDGTFLLSRKGKIALVSVYLSRLTEMQAQTFFMNLIEKIIKAEDEKEATGT